MPDNATTPLSSSSTPRSRRGVKFSSDNVLLAAGGVLFRLLPPSPTSNPPATAGTLQFCILYNQKSKHWILPKGRKDVNESLESAALRETFEETGYACEPLPCPMLTRAPNPGVYTGLKPHLEPASTEPFTVTLRTQKDGSMKLIFWYLMRVVSNSGPRVPGTQMANEDYDPHFINAREAVEKLSNLEYQSTAKLAVDLVENAMTSDCRPVFNS